MHTLKIDSDPVTVIKDSLNNFLGSSISIALALNNLFDSKETVENLLRMRLAGVILPGN